MFSHERLWAAIDVLAERNKLSASGLARRAGLDPTTFNKSKRFATDGRPRWPSTESLAKIMDATSTSLDEFTMIIRNEVAASNTYSTEVNVPGSGMTERERAILFENIEFVGQGLELTELPASSSEKVFALEITDESLLPLYRKGDTLIVAPEFSVRRGDRVVVRTVSGAIMPRILHRHTTHQIELHALNPDFPSQVLANRDVAWIAKILWASQ